jgi:hypothetical protein
MIITVDESKHHAVKKVTKLAKYDLRTTISSKHKEGPAIVRATGLKAATGKYLFSRLYPLHFRG